MKLFSAKVLLATIVGVGSVFFVGGLARSSGADRVLSANGTQKIAIDYPLERSVFPPEITPPTFLWHDASESAKRWIVDVSFGDHSSGIRVETPGELMKMGEIDPQASPRNELIQLTPEQAAARTWKPDVDTWAKMKRRSTKSPATITITGFADDDAKLAVSRGSVRISTSLDVVGAPVFYRDVPLIAPAPTEKGAIQPLPIFAIPLIKWRLRNIGEPRAEP
jgi:hypothetical protein